MKTKWMKRCAVLAVMGAPGIAAAAPPAASATVSDTQLSPSSWQYNVTLHDNSTDGSTIGTLWLAWTPGKDFMSATPTSITQPAGWTPAITTSLGSAIQWVDTATPEQPGGSLAFSFQSTEDPTTMFGIAPSYPGIPTLTSFAYSGGPFSDAGTQFLVTPTAVPEPTSIALGAPALLLLARRRRAA